MKRVIVNLLAHPRTLFLAYEFDVSLVTLQTELMKFIPEITAFLNTYVLECEYVSMYQFFFFLQDEK